MTLPVCLLAMLVAAATTQMPKPPEVVRIDGRQNPYELPEYLVWRSGFRLLAEAQSPTNDDVMDGVGLAADDAQAVYLAAKSQRERDAACEKNQHRVIEAFKASPPDELNGQLQAVILECRWQVLHVQEKLVAALTLEGQIALTTWITNRRSSINVIVLKHELEFFRKPR